MLGTRREFLRSFLAAAASLPFAGTALASGVLPPRKWMRTSASTQSHSRPASADDSALLDELERASFEFFWREADPYTGMVRDRAPAMGGGTSQMSSIAATGFALTALCIGCERKYRPAPLIVARVRHTLRFLAHQVPHVHGFFYHWVDLHSGKRVAFSEVSPIDMAILLCGVLTCREYFRSKEVSRDASLIYERVDWPWASNGGDTFALDWTPERGFSPLRWDSYCESMMLYLLAIGSPAHPIAPRCWRAFRRPWMDYRDYHYISSAAPLFVHQFSHAWFDFRGKHDEYADYFGNSVLAVQAHRQFCLELKSRFPGYSETAWGGPPAQGPLDGTIVPAAAAGSLPFLFDESVAVLRNLRERFGKRVWKRYGFVDAFNPLTGWIAGDVLGIDVGISMLMAENARTQLVWRIFMRNPEVRAAMEKCGFHDLNTPPTLYSMRSASSLTPAE